MDGMAQEIPRWRIGVPSIISILLSTHKVNDWQKSGSWPDFKIPALNCKLEISCSIYSQTELETELKTQFPNISVCDLQNRGTGHRWPPSMGIHFNRQSRNRKKRGLWSLIQLIGSKLDRCYRGSVSAGLGCNKEMWKIDQTLSVWTGSYKN